jgi:5'-nucleotidase
MTNKPLFLICNDDGVHAPGIKALAAAAGHFGDVVVVAPHEERSGFSQAITLTSPLRIDPIDERTFGVTGTPADCVILGFNKILSRRPDFVLSGINRGSNVGQDTLYSGTVAAAMEGLMQGAPGIAFSLDRRRAFELKDYQHASKVVHLVLEHLLSGKGWPQATDQVNQKTQQDQAHQQAEDPPVLPPKGILNVNIPDRSFEAIKGFKAAKLGRRIYDKQVVEQIDPRGRPYYWIGGGGEDIEDIPDTDCKYLQEGYVTLTALGPDHLDLVGQQRLNSIATQLDAKKRL